MAKSYEVLHDTWLRGRRYASGSYALLGEEDAAGYARAGLIKGDKPAVEKPVEAPVAPVEPTADPEPVKPERHKKRK